MTDEEVVALAREVLAGKSRSYVADAHALAAFILRDKNATPPAPVPPTPAKDATDEKP